MSVEMGCLVCAALCCLSPLICVFGVYMAVKDAIRDVKKDIKLTLELVRRDDDNNK